MGVCFGDDLGFGYCGILEDGVEEIDNIISVDVDVVDCHLAGFIEAQVGYFVVGAE